MTNGWRGIVKDKKELIVCLVAFLMLVIGVQCSLPPSATGTVEVGQAAPPFNLKDLSGREVSLDQYKGKIVILDFWATWCGPCRMTMPMLDKIQEEYSGKLSVLAINLQEPKNMVREYVLKQNLSSRVLLDEDYSIGTRYGTSAIPTQFLVDQNGIVRQIWTGYYPAAQIKAEINKLL